MFKITRTSIRTLVQYKERNLDLITKYQQMSPKAKSAWIPEPRDTITSVGAFLEAIGRNSKEHESKFKDWNHLFTISSQEMEKLGIKPRPRKYILSNREWYKKGVELYHARVKDRSLRKKTN